LNSTIGEKRRIWLWVALPSLLLVVGIVATPAVRRGLSAVDPLEQARAAYGHKDWSKAADFARTRLKAEGGDIEALRLLARSSVRLGRDGAAVSIYNDRLGAQGMLPEDRYLVGLTLARQGNEEAALEVWAKAAGEPPEQPELLLSLANLLARRQRLDEAARLAQRLSGIPGWESAGLLLLGTNRFSLEDHAAAVDSLRRGLELDPRATLAPLDPAVYRKTLARCLLFLGNPTEAESWLEPLLKGDSPGSGTDPEANWLASRSALQQHRIDQAKSALARSGTYRAEHPLEPEPSPYSGEAKCVSCHKDVGRAHEKTRHARTFHRGAELLELPRPSTPFTDPDHPDIVHTLVQGGKTLKVRTKIDDRIYETLVDYAFGTTDRYFSMVGRDGEGGYRAVRRSFFHEGEESGWGPTAGDQGHTDRVADVRGQSIQLRDGVVRCLHCHVTNPRALRDPDHVESGPEVADAGIGCERCHGPGAAHVLAVESDFPDRAIVSVGSGGGEAASRQCRECHIVGDASEMEHRREEPIWVRSPGATMTFSRCYTESDGALSCLTCHDPHRDSDRSTAFYEKRCLACHSPGTGATVAKADYAGVHAAKDSESVRADGPPRNSSVCKVNPTCDCLGCHMPKVRQPVLHTFLTDHYIRVHREEKGK
jgi:tetratricopeptide (TPR) repeat protein